ncbi:hypothetical protein JCM19235_1352 [Vibrio maritimus]|uniref:Uncharacterized protein n=1 Tax=Vibrio maritimus TaxID=990268 RepID=A0A090S686_9VIBR|nr:hypothetical protein JCM19235_1352 [Vibrio maritimus]
MNLVDFEVTKVLGQPEPHHHYWIVRVMAEAYGVESEQLILADTKEEALTIKVGHVFQG